MQRPTRLLSYLVVPFVWQLTTLADDSAMLGHDDAWASHSDSIGFSAYRQLADFGRDARFGVENYSWPFHNYTTWYRPKAFTLTKAQRCAPTPFYPRGQGNLFNRPCDSHRMDYAPYKLTISRSKYGPTYHRRLPDPQCDDCCLGTRGCRRH